nr:Chain A, CHIMERIC MINI-PROTEIN [synthetic construct]
CNLARCQLSCKSLGLKGGCQGSFCTCG